MKDFSHPRVLEMEGELFVTAGRDLVGAALPVEEPDKL